MLSLVGFLWLDLDPGDAAPKLNEILKDLQEIPDQSPPAAHATMEKHFNIKARQLKAWTPPFRSDREAQLFELCRILASSNIIVADTWACPGEPFEVRFTNLTPYAFRRPRHSGRFRFRASDRVSQYLGNHPTNLLLDAPLAGRTNDYHLYLKAPEGYYFTRQVASLSTESKKQRSKTLPYLAHKRNGKPQFQARSGPVTESHVLIVDGTSTSGSLDVGLSINELPLGSAWPAFIATASTVLVMSALLFAKWLGHGALGSASIPPLLVAFVSNSIGLASSLFAGERGRVSSILARLTLLSCAALGNCFAVWWLFNQSAPHERNLLLRTLKIYGGYGILAVTAVVMLVIFIRLRRVTRIYRAAGEGKFGGGASMLVKPGRLT
jgi:hypothetical protein